MPPAESANPLRFTFCVPAGHPALPGHFPGAPVVPGVVVLDHVLAHVQWPAGAPRRLAWVKFIKPLLPGQVATVTLCRTGTGTGTGNGAGCRFAVAHGDDVLVQGMLVPAMDAPPVVT